METLAIAALVGGLISFVFESVPAIKAWFSSPTTSLLAARLVLALVFFAVPLLAALAACNGVTFPGVSVTCPATQSDTANLIVNCIVALLGSQVWHAYGNRALQQGNSGGVG